MSTKKPKSAKRKPARTKEECPQHVGNDVLRKCPFRDVCPCTKEIVYVPVYIHPGHSAFPAQPPLYPGEPLYSPSITCGPFAP